jgi:hypothetical protein
MFNLIVVEGIDHIGKSTFINKLIDEMPKAHLINKHMMTSFADTHNASINNDIFEIRHIGALDSYQNTFATMKDLPSAQGITLIADRLHWTEYAYGMALRRQSVVRIYGEEGQLIRYTQEFEKQCNSIFDNTIYLSFVLKGDSNPIDDEYVTASKLKSVNSRFELTHQFSLFGSKIKTILKMDNESGLSDIMENFDCIKSIIDDVINTGENVNMVLPRYTKTRFE